jgi:hypothetical protein
MAAMKAKIMRNDIVALVMKISLFLSDVEAISDGGAETILGLFLLEKLLGC